LASESAEPLYRDSLAQGHVNLADLLESAGRGQEAENACRKAVALWQDLTDRSPRASGYALRLAQVRHRLAGRSLSAGRYGAAGEEYRAILKLLPDSPRAQTDLARFLATCPDARLRDPKQAVELARKAVRSDPRGRPCWNTLGVALYRTGRWKGATQAFKKSMALGQGGDASDWFFLAMTCWQLGEKGEARRWFAGAVAWAEKNAPGDEELRRFRADAAALLGVKAKKE
jgi:tetratricopeptide (TPR) repeat protein